MARNEVVIDAAPQRVFDVLSDASLYADWVVGAQRVRGADAAWPSTGAELEHSSGLGPLTIDDTTEVLEADPPRRLLLLAHLGAVGSIRVELRLEPIGDGTRVVMDEEPAEGAGAALHNPLADAGPARAQRTLLAPVEGARRSVRAAVRTGAVRATIPSALAA